ncbi:ketol-acid reductoisomerase [Salmonella bongori]|nr:ketol-acid reductoisomerase [Salmonella bongori]
MKVKIGEQEYFDKGVLMIAMVKAGVELAFETMVDSGIIEESAYYESLHELPLIANTIARKRLYEMNVVISDTAEYGNYLFSYACVPLLKPFMAELQPGDLGKAIPEGAVDNAQLRDVNDAIRGHAIEQVGKETARVYDGYEAYCRRWLIPRRLSTCRCVGYVRTPQSHRYLCSWGCTHLPPSCKLKSLREGLR